MMFFSSVEELCWFSIMVSEGDYRIMDSSKKIGEASCVSKVTLGMEIANSFPQQGSSGLYQSPLKS